MHSFAGFEFPSTPEQRKAGMAAFRAKLLRAKESVLTDPAIKLTKRQRAEVEGYCDAIRAAQKMFGEV